MELEKWMEQAYNKGFELSKQFETEKEAFESMSISEPENMTLDELTCLGRGLNIPIEDLRQCITY